MKRLRRLAVVVSGGLLAGYLVVCGLLFGLQRELTFPSPRFALAVTDGSARVNVPGGTFLLWKRVPGEGPVVVHFHGNGEQVSYLAGLSVAFARQGVSFVAVEYPGYPGAGGEASEASILAAAEAALVHLTGELKIDRARIVLEGQSLGTGVAVTLATRGWGARLVLLSPYTSLPEVASTAFPWLPTGLLLLDRFDSEAQAPSVRVPTLVLHGTLDDVVPLALGQTLGAAIPGARFLAIDGAHHQDLLDGRAAQAVLFAFVNER